MESTLKKCFSIIQGDFIRAGEASIKVQNILKSLNFEPKLIRRIAICGYEGEMNVVMHGSNGLLCAEINSGKVILDISDEGPGIEDINLAMQKGYSTAKDEYREMGFGAGMGLPNMKKNADDMTVESDPKKGTLIRMFFNIAKEE